MEEKIKSILLEILFNKTGQKSAVNINESTKLREDLGLDSFSLAELTVHLEDEFEIDIFEDGIVNTVGEIYAKINRVNEG